MRSEVLVDAGAGSHVVVMEEGDEAVAALNDFFARNGVRSARCSAIGGLQAVTLGWFDPGARRYHEIPFEQQLEVVSLIGDVAHGDDGLPHLHAHCVVADRTGRAYGGHLLRAVVRPTLEVFVEESAVVLHRRHDAKTGLALIDLPQT
jgi:predicted DNA-binding protein with PD1-like motif